MFRSVSQRFALQPLRGFHDLRDTPLHLSVCVYSPALRLNLPCSGYASTAKRADGYVGFLLSLRSMPNPTIRQGLQASVLLLLRSNRTLAPFIINHGKIKKSAKEAPRRLLVKVLRPYGFAR